MSKDEALDAFKNAQSLADALGITRHAIYQWGDPIPEYRALQIAKIIEERNRDQFA